MVSFDQGNLMLYGIIGDIARAGAEGKGLNPISIAMAIMTWLSAAVSPKILVPLGDGYHSAKIYSVHVGRSAIGGKGDSLNLLKKIIRLLDEKYPELSPMFHSGGLSTKEGLALKLHDGYMDKGRQIEPILDKRLFILESEFVKLLALSKNNNNTILPTLRDVWDHGSAIYPLTKHNPIKSTSPHVAIYGNVTPNELRATLNPTDIYGGTVNRFLFFYAERLKAVAFPSSTPHEQVAFFTDKLARIITWSKMDYGTSNDNGQATIACLSDNAKAFWVQEHKRISSNYGSPLVAEATGRRTPYALRLALLFAITDQSLIIEHHHLRAAIAWVDFSAQTADYLFGDGVKKAKANGVLKEKLINFLSKQPNREASRTEISKHCFKGKVPSAELTKLFEALQGSVIDKHEQISGNNKKSTYKLL
jgi:hypothetical protein